jgi:hypothetical protein
MKATTKTFLYCLSVIAVIVIIGMAFLRNADNLLRHSKARVAWKNRAVEEITRRTSDTNWVTQEFTQLALSATNRNIASDAWLSSSLIVMTNGEWIAYDSICSKENFWIRDLFIGHASDGKWYYSTYHFCINMVVLSMMSEINGQPRSIEQFANDYYLQIYDGVSDICLGSTWPQKNMKK